MLEQNLTTRFARILTVFCDFHTLCKENKGLKERPIIWRRAEQMAIIETTIMIDFDRLY